MMNLSDKEKGILLTIDALSNFFQINAIKQNIIDKGKEWGEDYSNCDDVYDSLLKKGMIEEIDNQFLIPNNKIEFIDNLRKEAMEKNFSESLIKLAESKIHSIYCEKIYGKNLSQLNIASMNQINKLMELLNLNANNIVLDLGCGVGRIAEYISDITNANVTGFDFAGDSIKRSLEKSKAKRDRLNFIKGNMNNIDLPDESFDTIISIDTLYFVEDIVETVKQMNRILKSGGQMGIFYSQVIEKTESRENLLPNNTQVAKALQESNLKYTTIDYTEEERNYWKKSVEVAEELKMSFEKEGNIAIYNGLIGEGSKMLEVVKEKCQSRYLYYVKKN